jgi:hypothetical protein
MIEKQRERCGSFLAASYTPTALENKASPFSAMAGCFPCPCEAAGTGRVSTGNLQGAAKRRRVICEREAQTSRSAGTAQAARRAE